MSIVKFILKEWVSEGNYNETLLGTYKMPESPIIGDSITMTDASTKQIDVILYLVRIGTCKRMRY